MEKHNEGLLREDPITLNYAVTITAFELTEGNPKIFLVDYQNSKLSTQVRLPAGRFQTKNLVDAVESFLEKNGRNMELEFFCHQISIIDNDHTQSTIDMTDFAELNEQFNKFTLKLLKGLQNCRLSENEFKEILFETHVNTAKHELEEEIAADSIGRLFLSSVVSNDGSHYKIGFTSAEVKAPRSYVGSPDRKIRKSYLADVSERTQSILFNGHAKQFQEGVRELCDQNAHPNVKKLIPYLTAIR